MGSQKNAKSELKSALADATNAQLLLSKALKTVEKSSNKQLLQDALSNINQAVDVTKTSYLGFKD